MCAVVGEVASNWPIEAERPVTEVLIQRQNQSSVKLLIRMLWTVRPFVRPGRSEAAASVEQSVTLVDGPKLSSFSS